MLGDNCPVREREERVLESGAGNLEITEGSITRQQLTNDGLGGGGQELGAITRRSHDAYTVDRAKLELGQVISRHAIE